MKKRRLLLVSHKSPLPVLDGGSLRIQNLLENITAEWDIDLICPEPSSKIPVDLFKKFYNNILLIPLSNTTHIKRRQGLFAFLSDIVKVERNRYCFDFESCYDERYAKTISSFAQLRDYDAILASSAAMYGFYLSDQKELNVACDVCDSLSLYLQSLLSKCRLSKEWLSLYFTYLYNLRWERAFLSNCKKLIVISERDKKWLRKSIRDVCSISVIENGIDLNKYHPGRSDAGSFRELIVFTGVMGYAPNHDAMLFCIKEIWPLIKALAPNAKMKIVGRYPLPELYAAAKETTDIEITGEVDDIQSAVKGAGVFLCPMRIGSGMKNKILEALAMGIPVVATREAVTGIEFQHKKTGFIANTPQELAQYAATLIEDKTLWLAVSKDGRQLVEKRYSWLVKSNKLSYLLNQ